MAIQGLGVLGLGAGFLGLLFVVLSRPGGGGGGEGEEASKATHATELAPIVVAVESKGRALDVVLRRAGVTPAALAAAGVGTVGLGTTLTGADGWLVEHQESLANIDAGCGAARREHDALQREVRSGLAGTEEIAALQQAKATLAQREAARDSALQAIFVAATAGLSGPQVTTLAAIRANAGRSAPMYFLVEEREPAIWLRLRDALANERIAPLFEDEPDSEAQSFLAALRARQAVAQAKSQHDALIGVVEASWNASLHGPN